MEGNVFQKSLVKLLFAAIYIFFLSFPINSVYSRNSSEITDEIVKKQKELDKLNSDLSSLEKQIKLFENQKKQTDESIANLNNAIAQIQTEISYNDLKIQKLASQEALLLLQEEQKKGFVKSKIIELYISEKHSAVDSVLDSREIDFNVKTKSYRELILGLDLSNLNQVTADLASIREEKKLFEKGKEDLRIENVRLEKLISDYNKKIASYNKSINDRTNSQNQIRSRMSTVQTQIAELTKEQQEALKKEADEISQGSGRPDPLVPGEYYFTGRGRDLYDGHGVGLSQWGAYGMAEKGLDYKQILSIYYTSTQVLKYTAVTTINVSGYGTMNINDYVSGLGEIPDKACGTDQQVQLRPDKYVVDNPLTVWDCWPEEAIKAQVVAARSYGLATTQNGGTICTTASCQVYKGGDAKKWAADETSYEVVIANGTTTPIAAYYHSSARGHTENNEYVWTAKGSSTKSIDDLKGWGKSFTRGVDDSQYSYKNSYYDWNWRTNSYSLDELSAIFSRDSGTDVGSIISITLHRGSSKRAWAVTLIGSKGTKYVTSWKLKAVFNDFIYSNYAVDKRAYMFSTEFYFLKV